MRFNRLKLLAFLPLAGLPACGADLGSPQGESRAGQALAADPGALVKMELNSTVGVLLDEIPAGPARERAAAEALALSQDAWRKRAAAQTKLTYYRLVFRGEYYSGYWNNASTTKHDKGPLPLPPDEVWNFSLGQPRRVTTPSHDEVVLDYTFSSHILTDVDSPGIVEPNLATVGGTWDEPFNLPTDPELLLQRTGYACMDEFEYPAGSVFEENTFYFYDDSCNHDPVGNSVCHITQFPQESCVEALQKHTDIVKTAVHFTRVAWSDSTAAAVHVGTIASHPGADLAVVQDGLDKERRVFYRYFTNSACDLDEGTVGATGWRQLLAFSAIVRNDGTERLHIGDPNDVNNPWRQNNDFTFSACHNHYHFTHYGSFLWDDAQGSKKAFCLEDTNRFHNDVQTPLWAEHQSCEYQGIGHGWGDEYEFGIPGQWVDVTSKVTGHPEGVTADLTFQSNPDKFICEGHPLPNPTNPDFVATPFVTPDGLQVNRMKCDSYDAPDVASGLWSGWDADNLGVERNVTIHPGDSFVTAACDRNQIGPKRDCGFRTSGALKACTPGSTVQLTCSATAGSSPQVLRVCERSAALGIGLPCSLAESASNLIIDGPTTVSFTCPAVRDSASGAGGYQLYQTPLLPSMADAQITCN